MESGKKVGTLTKVYIDVIPLTLTLKLGVTLVLTVTQVYVFVNLCQVTGMPP